MPINCFLPSEDETTLNVHFPDGQESILIDCVDLETLVLQAQKCPEDTTIGDELARLFKQKYDRKVSKHAVLQLWNLAYDTLESVKKKLLQGLDSSSTTT